ncbi:hypothetical protein CK203_023390 [Vitis vinifera]|uniref:Uncharacterized protein n=1 Tax=Vitis vinifera TaxID=29760 RepID=A0A438J6C6_VITVI|nr:hypothetical protein CK203_023390 [Vitis vinifera]
MDGALEVLFSKLLSKFYLIGWLLQVAQLHHEAQAQSWTPQEVEEKILSVHVVLNDARRSKLQIQ